MLILRYLCTFSISKCLQKMQEHFLSPGMSASRAIAEVNKENISKCFRGFNVHSGISALKENMKKHHPTCVKK